MKSKKIFCLITALFCLILAGCAKDVPPGNYDASEVGKVKKVISGTIISMRPVNIRNKTAENTATNTTPTTEVADNGVTRSHGFEYVIRLNSGAVISVVQTDTVTLKVKQHVLVIYGENTRVVADDGGEDY